MSLTRRPDFKESGRFPNRITNQWRLHRARWQGVSTLDAWEWTDLKWGTAMYRVSDGVRSTHGQDGAIVLDIEQGQMFNMNLVGSKILELLEHGSTEPEIVTVICGEFNASREVVEGDVREFIESLKKHKLIHDRQQTNAL